MLKEATIKKMASLLKIKPEDLTAAITAQEETDIEIDDTLTLFDESEVALLKKNNYEEGKKAGSDLVVKAAKEKLGYNFPGKGIDELLNHHAEIAKKSVSTDHSEREKELSKKIEALTETNTTLEKQLTEERGRGEAREIESTVFENIDLPDGVKITKREVLALAGVNGIQFKKDTSGNVVAAKGEQIITGKTGDPRPIKDLLSEFMAEKNIIPVSQGGSGGRGGGSSSGGTGKPRTKTELEESFKANGKSLNGEEYNAAWMAAIEDPNFNRNS